ncbi:MAG TPA: glycine cleavage system protein GcvH [Microbacteriaceae bacterium]|nr:glycine cleavage system protein GcvH [Microbacteriaceae bacterium]
MIDTSTLRYTAEHEWIALDGDVATIGLTRFAADSLGDVVYLDLPAVGTRVVAARVCGEVESTKSVSEIYSPVDGEVVEVNQAVLDTPELVNTDPYDGGWLFRARFDAAPDGLLDEAAYREMVGE